MARLEGRTAIVTGGAMGIGRHYSKALAAEGAQVMIADIADGSALAAEIAAKHGRNSTDSMMFDVSDEAQCKALVGQDHRALRQDRHSDQQRRALCAAADAQGHRDRRRAVGQGDGHQHPRAVPDGQARRPAHDRQKIRQDRQHRLGHRGARHSGLLALRHLQGRGDGVHPLHVARTRRPRHLRQHAGAGLHAVRHRPDQHRACRAVQGRGGGAPRAQARRVSRGPAGNA